ncbi:hypothetical protein NJB86_004210 [Salmonella enterica]|nr:hypothetical protein [Salmonella enterica]
MSDLISAFLRRFRGYEPIPDGFGEKTQQSATGAGFNPFGVGVAGSDEALTGVINDMEQTGSLTRPNGLITNPNHYRGKQCRKCGSETRYKKSRRCVECKHRLSAAEWEKKKNKLIEQK